MAKFVKSESGTRLVFLDSASHGLVQIGNLEDDKAGLQVFNTKDGGTISLMVTGMSSTGLTGENKSILTFRGKGEKDIVSIGMRNFHKEVEQPLMQVNNNSQPVLELRVLKGLPFFEFHPNGLQKERLPDYGIPID